MRRDIKFSPPDISNEEISEVIDTLKSGWITTGPKTKLFENEIAKFCCTKKAVCLNSATACMEMTLRLLEIKPGDEVITSAYTYTASCSVIHHVGAKPVLIDTAKDSFEMDYQKLYDAINEKTKAIIPIDLAGILCDYDKIFKVVNSKKSLFNPNNKIQEKIGRIVVIADSAHSFGAQKDNHMSGQIADFTVFSFHAVKNLTTAEGGAVTWKTIDGIYDSDIYSEYMLLSLHGQTKNALSKNKYQNWEYDIIIPGYKYNMTDTSASLGLAQLKRYSQLLNRRKEIVSIYNDALRNYNFQLIQDINDNKNISCNHLYMVRILNKGEVFRNQIIKQLGDAGVPTNVHYKPLPLLKAYRDLGFNIANYPNAYDMYKNEITLPLHTLLTDDDVEYVINKFIELNYYC